MLPCNAKKAVSAFFTFGFVEQHTRQCGAVYENDEKTVNAQIFGLFLLFV